MPDGLLNKIDFARYERWIARTSDRACTISVYDAAGVQVWGEQDPAAAEHARLLLQAPQRDETAVQRLDLADGKTMLYRPLQVEHSVTTGWVTLIADAQEMAAAPLQFDRFAEALDDAAAGIEGEAVANNDLNKMAEELAQCYEELHLVYATDGYVRTRAGPHEDSLRELLQSTAEHMHADVAAFLRPDENLCVYATCLSKEIHNLDLVLVEMRGDLFRFIQSSKEPLVLNAAEDPHRAYVFTNMPYRILACPVQITRSVDGIVVLLRHMQRTPFTNNDRRLLEVLGNQLSSLGKSFLLVRSLNNFTEQLAEAMVQAVEAKDPYTRGHSERVNFLSMEIGRALDLPSVELADLHWGSLLHDVGKIGIPDAVLCKPARLTKGEYTFIKVHPERSYEILRNVEQLKSALPGARHHQEMWDGTGYPHGLKGERIPLHARIIAVADTYDSITSSRAYRAGKSHEFAMREIMRVCGTQLDPKIVEVFNTLCAAEPEWLKRFSIRREEVQ